MANHQKSDLDHARDELMSHIHRCGVLKASHEQQQEWLEDTMQFMAERYGSLTEPELAELREIGLRFCQPVIPHGRGNTALSTEEADEQTAEESEGDSEREEMAGVA